MSRSGLTRMALLAALVSYPGLGAAQTVRETLPVPDPPFQGKIGLRPSDSVKDFPAEPTAPEGAPKTLPKTIPYRVSLDETLDIGEDTGTPISEDYPVPFKFTGTLEKVTINIAEQKLTEEELRQYREGLVKSALAQ